ncbi:MAG TPA: hypothetical protein VGM14_08345 [Streptosporangiaceae bacterium]
MADRAPWPAAGGGVGRAGLGRDGEQVVIEPEEAGQGALGCGQGGQAGRDRRLELFLILIVERVLVALPDSVGR